MVAEVILIGVGHVFDIATRVRNIIVEKKPDVVAVELDYGRAMALINGGKGGRKSNSNVLYYILAKLQKRISRKFGVESGEEMLAALKAAEEIEAAVYFMDMDANMVIQKLWNSMSFRRKIQVFILSFLSLFFSKKKVEGEIEKFEKSPNEYLDIMGKNFPEFKKILIDERNEYMASQLKNFLIDDRKILAVVGEGHIEGIKKILEDENIKVEVIHLANLMKS